ncbi:Rpn family recombination-promoting nuclease/putative transposase [Brachyspira aalborgi]|uniref:Rpn family recombination-promoting nuclease/putative transposase n=1 Tax=Brachyspira aalborgi TaxID=29522 RepID=A0A5C8EJM9_9SPIR|nr:Rpn family recombination-promoting nuclease/putative transposase [Brachyspira aalborgi]TXJ37985.1 Rpn family recombination-promoting nuclease/putative transposase [Brachyspira aalborgi]
MKHEEEVYKLSDLFARYLLGKNGNEDLLTDLVNSTLREFNFEEVKDLEIIDPSPKAGFSLNLSKNIELKESIIDIKAKTKNNETVIIEFQLCGNMDFLKRIFYYISKNVVNEVTLTAGRRQEGENYNNVQKIISINLLDFNLKFGDKGKAHRCFKLIDTKDLNISLDLIQIHILEVKRFIEIIKNSTKEELKNNRLLSWMKFFTSDNLELIEDELKEENQIMSKVIEEYRKFTSDDKMMRAYAAREAFLVGQKMMLRREREDGFDEGIEEGIKIGKLEGIKEGEKNKAVSMAKSMKTKNLDINLISEITGLTIDEIEKL